MIQPLVVVSQGRKGTVPGWGSLGPTKSQTGSHHLTLFCLFVLNARVAEGGVFISWFTLQMAAKCKAGTVRARR